MKEKEETKNELRLEKRRLELALSYVDDYSISIDTADGEITVNILNNGEEYNISSSHDSTGIYDIIDEIIFKKLDRGYVDIKIEMNITEFSEEMYDNQNKFMYDEKTIYRTKVNWINRKNLSPTTQLELYGNIELPNLGIYIYYCDMILDNQEIDVKKILTELANESTVALDQSQVSKIKDELNRQGFTYETWRRNGSTIISLIEPGDNEMLLECLEGNEETFIKSQQHLVDTNDIPITDIDKIAKISQKQIESDMIHYKNKEEEKEKEEGILSVIRGLERLQEEVHEEKEDGIYIKLSDENAKILCDYEMLDINQASFIFIGDLAYKVVKKEDPFLSLDMG